MAWMWIVVFARQTPDAAVVVAGRVRPFAPLSRCPRSNRATDYPVKNRPRLDALNRQWPAGYGR